MGAILSKVNWVNTNYEPHTKIYIWKLMINASLFHSLGKKTISSPA